MFKRFSQFQYSFKASADLSDYQFRFVKLNSKGELELALPGDFPFGILLNKPLLGQVGNVVTYGGGQEVVVESAITAGDAIVVGEEGKALGVEIHDPRPKVGFARTSQTTADERVDIDLEYLGGGELIWTGDSGADLSGDSGKFVERASNGRITVCNANNEATLGVLLNEPGNRERAVVALVGARCEIVAGASVAAGAIVSTTNAGLAVTASGTNRIAAKAITPGTANNKFQGIVLDGFHPGS